MFLVQLYVCLTCVCVVSRPVGVKDRLWIVIVALPRTDI